MTTDRTQLAKLVQPIPERFIKRDPDSGEAYVPHGVIKQFLLYILGPYDFEQVTILRSDVLKRKDKEFIEGNSPLLLTNVVVGATYRLSCEIDGRRTVVEETGEVEHPEQCPHDGARLKNAESDAIKRIANCIGLGLHLWAGELYVLHGWLPVPSRDGQTDKSGAERPARAAGTNGDAEPGSATSAPDPAPGTSGPAVPGKVTAGPDPTPATRKTSRRKTKATEDPPAEPPAPAATAGAAPAAAAPAPPAVAAGATNNGHPADRATGMEELAAALGRSLTNCWLRLRRAAQGGELPAQPFAELADAGAVKQLAGDDFDLAKAWLLDHHDQGAAA